MQRIEDDYLNGEIKDGLKRKVGSRSRPSILCTELLNRKQNLPYIIHRIPKRKPSGLVTIDEIIENIQSAEA